MRKSQQVQLRTRSWDRVEFSIQLLIRNASRSKREDRDSRSHLTENGHRRIVVVKMPDVTGKVTGIDISLNSLMEIFEGLVKRRRGSVLARTLVPDTSWRVAVSQASQCLLEISEPYILVSTGLLKSGFQLSGTRYCDCLLPLRSSSDPVRFLQAYLRAASNCPARDTVIASSTEKFE
ncbi:hypothetical protein J6590_062189 [Homalodisca vitripennis]|nr:hypothetical protein J6590_062189 [Homalodisca vitripennis]